MSISAKRLELSKLESTAQGQTLDHEVDKIISSMEVACDIRLGTTTLSVSALKTLAAGQVLQLKESLSAPVEILLEGQVIAWGELLACDDRFALKITKTA